MNQGTSKQYTEFIFRRMTEPFSLFGYDLPAQVWWFVLLMVLFVGFIYVGIMYYRDSRGVGIVWAGILGLLRLSVYGVLAFIFLLPAKQSWEEVTNTSKVVVLFDVSQSMGTRDDLPQDNVPYDKMLTRADKLLSFLENSQTNFFGSLEKKNPITALRLARGLDEESIYFDGQGGTFTKTERAKLEEDMKKPDFNKDSLPRHRGRWDRRFYEQLAEAECESRRQDRVARRSRQERRRARDQAARAQQEAGDQSLFLRHQRRRRRVEYGQSRNQQHGAGHRHLHGWP